VLVDAVPTLGACVVQMGFVFFSEDSESQEGFSSSHFSRFSYLAHNTLWKQPVHIPLVSIVLRQRRPHAVSHTQYLV
jgi:hypothetical protein